MKLLLKRSHYFWRIYLILFKNKLSHLERVLYTLFSKKQISSIVQVGSNDGISGDPLFKFIKAFKIKSILIEPIPFLYQNLKRNYKKSTNIVFLNIAISESNSFMKIYFFTNVLENNYPKWLLQLGSFNENHSNQLIDTYPKLTQNNITVNTLSLNNLFNNYFTPDLLHIDTEGYDYEIIKSLKFMQFKPKFILYENVHLSIKDKDDCLNLLKSNGYTISHFNDDSLAILNTI